MLNEVYLLWQACERCGIDLPERVPGFDEGQNADGVRVYLDAEGSITRLEAVPADRMAKVRKWKRGEGITLPVFNFEPLHKRTKARLDMLKRVFAKSAKGRSAVVKPPRRFQTAEGALRWDRGSQSRFRKLQGALDNVSADLKKRIGTDSKSEGEAWRQMLDRLSHLSAEKLLAELSGAVRERIASGAREPIWLAVLYHDAATKKAGTFPVQFEPEGQFEYPIFSPDAQAWIKGILLRSLQPAEKSTEKQPAIWGDGATAREKFRDVTLPLGKVSLFNKNSGAKKTSARYGAGGPESFPVGNDVRMKLMASLEWLLAKEREQATWTLRQLAGGGKKGGKKQSKFFLLLAYPSQLSETPPSLACLFGGDASSEANRAELRFESVSLSVVAALDGILKTAPNAQINVFAIHKPDPGRAQVFFSEVMAAAQLRELAAAWQRDARQYPPIVISQFPSLGKEEWQRRKKEKITTNPENYEPAIPFPYDVVECLNTVWQKCTSPAETKIDEAQDASLSDAFELLRSDGPKADVHYLARLLELAVRRATPLLLAVGQAAHQRGHRVFAPPKASAKCAFQSLRWPAIFGLLLTRLNYKLETYMTESAYLIGRLLAQVDRLHSYYGLLVSGKEQMTQLLGNSLMAVALEQPRQAFELLGQRILPYQAWATSFSRGKYADQQKQKDANAVGGILWELGQIAAELARRTIPEENVASVPAREGYEARPPAKHLLDAKDYVWMSVGSAAKAQMLLGYLARPPKKSSDVDRGGADSLPGFDVDAVPLSSASSEASTQTTKA